MKELVQTDLRWNGLEFLKRSKQDWPECKFDKPTSTQNLQLTGAKETGTKEATTYQITKEGGETANVGDVWRLDPLRDTRNGAESKRKENWKLGVFIYRQL